jgi:hypothetical protein
MNKELLQANVPKEMNLGVGTLCWDIPPNQISEFASNQIFRPMESQMAYAYQQQLTAFVADQVAPFKGVRDLQGQYRKYDERLFFDRPKVLTGPDEMPGNVMTKSTLEEYDLTGRALACFLSNAEKSQAERQYGSVQEWRNFAVKLMTYLMTLDREITVATLAQATGTYAAGYTAIAAPLWSDPAADLIGDCSTGEDLLLSDGETYVMGNDIWRTLQKHPAVTGSATAMGANINVLNPRVGVDFLRSYFGRDNIVIGKAKYNTTPYGDTLTLDYIWDDYLTICHAQGLPGGGDMNSPFLTTLVLEGEAIPNYRGWGVKSVPYNMSFVGGEYVMCGYFAQEKIYAQKSGYLLQAL